jgi:hypothetical protein
MMPGSNIQSRAVFMAIDKKKSEGKWLEKAIEQLNRLCREAAEYADEDDVVPSNLAHAASVQILHSFQRANRPKMGLTVNGEISLAWENTGDEFRAYVKPDGSVQYFRNKAAIDERSFNKYLTAIPA